MNRLSTMKNKLENLLKFKRKTRLKLPLYGYRISAGFPSPADDHLENSLDLNDYLIERPAATFFVRAAGNSMLGAGIQPGDLLIVDRSKEPKNNCVILATVGGEYTVKRYCKKGSKIILKAENPAYEPLEITAEMEFQVWGVATYVIHSLK